MNIQLQCLTFIDANFFNLFILLRTLQEVEKTQMVPVVIMVTFLHTFL